MMNSNSLLIGVVIILIALAVSYIPSFNGKNVGITGSQVEVPVPSTATISRQFALIPSTTLGSGIVWSNLNPSQVDVAANGNNDVGNTEYYITVSADSNVNVDFCLNADRPLTDDAGVPPGNVIPLSNYEWDSATTASGPINTGVIMLQAPTYSSADTNIAPGSSDFFRFWLSVPSGQAPGTYTNMISFKGVITGSAC